MFTYREAKQRCQLYGYELYILNGKYIVENSIASATFDDLDECVDFAMGRVVA